MPTVGIWVFLCALWAAVGFAWGWTEYPKVHPPQKITRTIPYCPGGGTNPPTVR